MASAPAKGPDVTPDVVWHTAHGGLANDAINVIGIGMKAIVCHFIPDEGEDNDTAGNADGESQYVQQGKKRFPSR